VVKILKHLPEKALEWKLCDVEPMDDWTLPGGKIILLGDAAHAVLPSASQGAAMAIEDGGAIAEILSQIETKYQIDAALKAYQELRMPRTAEVRDSGRRNVARWKSKDTHEESTNDYVWDYDVKADARKMKISN
jgi:salicylate hydroxylase